MDDEYLRRPRMMSLAAPEFLPCKLDLVGQRVLWLSLTAQQRAETPFLDERALPQAAAGGWLPMASLFATDPTQASADGIFHITSATAAQPCSAGC